ncbi:MAG: flagellar biosynthetic protein FliQ [Candidatus Brocadia sp. AMX2]|uniref:Flagellar biosynthetic protein n=1 Tax=Candidatus Brocadia sinica JPN1 TaxID=1197129 RepID=A0ABQ0JZG0_9BACT|nr:MULTISPECIES: flagellar biosynthetic protein FliQ [Brocadia]KXK30959.1 MAG: flagellar biosynthetic protein FliQ [Candidatus Brocadia sinica]MBC6931269.1 flagellar biosynthetic protein FliQ [Candidatus Brocadia sp.]MBL1168560.1 flagellar biosynthetic protein FliQ [Candidatus Brocadia sp. AMX1]NOG40094.1 flagellar biosynthetic protein FliQ [Planctomycetota bacterium]KAA0246032.1 MAG: flagellar biosynthetic protein FliQ [Candidatus Brocadia sp. AMX2]
MTTEIVVHIGKELLQITVVLMGPLLVVAMVVGLIVGIFQTISSIHEQTITFLPKIFAVMGVFLLCLPWMLRMITSYTVNLLGNLTRYCQ